MTQGRRSKYIRMVLGDLLHNYTFWQLIETLADVMDDKTKDSPSFDYRKIGEKIRAFTKELQTYCGRGD